MPRLPQKAGGLAETQEVRREVPPLRRSDPSQKQQVRIAGWRKAQRCEESRHFGSSFPLLSFVIPT
jgi:hypothetical protein